MRTMQAVRLDPSFSESFKFKGKLLYSQENYDQSLIAYSQANSVQKDMTSFAGNC